MQEIENICKKYNIGLCYLFGSQQENGLRRLAGEPVLPASESDMDFGVVFISRPENAPEAYAELSLAFQALVSPERADLLFMQEADHLLQWEAIKGTVLFAQSEDFRSAYEEKVLMLATDELENFKKNQADFFQAVADGYFEFKYQAN